MFAPLRVFVARAFLRVVFSTPREMTRIEIWARPNADIGSPTEEQRWYRKGVWEDGEVVEGDLAVAGNEDADTIRKSYDGRNSVAVDPEDRGPLFERRVERGLVTMEDVQAADLGDGAADE